MILHFITCRHPRGGLYSVEGDPARPFPALVSDIATGDLEDITSVYRIDSDTGFGADVTRDVARALCDWSHDQADELYYEIAPFVERYGFEPFRRDRHDPFYEKADRLYDARVGA